MRSTVIAVTVAAIVLAGSFAVLLTDDSSADGPDFSDFYMNQLTDDGKNMYNTLENLSDTPTFTSVEVGDQSINCVSVTVSGVSGTSGSLYEEFCGAWLATKLTDPLAWWTWSYDNAYDAVSRDVTVSGGGATFKIYVTPSYADAINDGAVGKTGTAITGALDGLGFTATTSDAEKVKRINNYLCGDGFEYDPAVSSGDTGNACAYNGSAYGAFVNEVDGKHVIVCSGYAAAFQALCKEGGIPCLSVYGTWVGSSSSALHAWNLVTLNSKVYAVDTTFNATGSSSDAYLAVGLFSDDDGANFSQTHQPFTTNISLDTGEKMFWGGMQSYLGVSEEAYKWPAETGIAVVLEEWGPWIVVSLICIILAYVLFSIGKKGGQ